MTKKSSKKSLSSVKTPAKIRIGDINDHMKKSYLDYAYSVIVGRALPDVRDGLKPVHRRVIYTCYENKFMYNKPHKKSARIVGDVMGKYHPHGDLSVYLTIVRMAQDFNMRYPLIDGQGNFGSIDGDSPAASRYTEARLARIASEMIADIEKDTVDFTPNYDESLEEPLFLPSKIPALLMNGVSGIAVGMRTNMPPYNLSEIIAAIKAVIKNPNIYPEELNNYIMGPDFPTSGIIVGRKGIRNIINQGRGKITIRGRVEIETKKNHNQIVVTEIPYEVDKSKLVESIAKLINKKKIQNVIDLRDESSRKGIRIVLELKKLADANAIKNRLYKYTHIQKSYSVVNLVLVNDGKQPAILNMKELIEHFIQCRENVIIRRTQFDLKKAQDRLHIIDGLLIAIDHIDEIIQIIKKSSDPDVAKTKLIAKYSLSDIQATEILNMPLKRLTGLQQQKLVDEKKELLKNIKDYKDILANKSRRMKIIDEEITEIDEKFGDERRTEIIDAVDESDQEAVLKTISDINCVVMLTKNQYIKRMKLKTYQSQNRGGKGKRSIKIREEDMIEDVYVVSSHDILLLFTKKGRVYQKYAYEIPMMSRTSKGKALVNFIGLKQDEQIVHMIPVSDFEEEAELIFVTKSGKAKKTKLNEYQHIRRNGIYAISLKEDDEVINVKLTNPEMEQKILIATKKGYALKFPESELRPIGRTAMGVKGITLREGDEIVDMILGDNETDIITITNKGYGKRSKLELYRETKRAGKGVINIKFHSPDDFVVAVKSAMDEDLLIVTNNGIMIRVPSVSLRSLSRSAMGVRVIELNENDSVSSVALCEPASDDKDDKDEKNENDQKKSNEKNDEIKNNNNKND
ncbi:MAG: DNA gyrase subunit A [Candidatus Lokiarchaeota archaeon]|nr:DNA gyrase subunit A [Candidatus Lokiarchaeota archaeon]